jgi:hypothetical protein
MACAAPIAGAPGRAHAFIDRYPKGNESRPSPGAAAT